MDLEEAMENFLYSPYLLYLNPYSPREPGLLPVAITIQAGTVMGGSQLLSLP